MKENVVTEDDGQWSQWRTVYETRPAWNHQSRCFDFGTRTLNTNRSDGRESKEYATIKFHNIVFNEKKKKTDRNREYGNTFFGK